MGSILVSQSGVYQSARQRALDTEAQQSGAAGGGSAASVTARAAEGSRPAETAAASAVAPVLDPTQVRSRIDGLIDGHVASGRLTGDQGRVLKQVLGSGTAGQDTAAADGSPPAGSAAQASVVQDTAAQVPAAQDAGNADPASAEQADGRQNPSEMLASFIRQLQTVQSRTVGYASDGSSEGAKLTSSRLLDFNT